LDCRATVPRGVEWPLAKFTGHMRSPAVASAGARGQPYPARNRPAKLLIGHVEWNKMLIIQFIQ
jgi:hypothetical protein